MASYTFGDDTAALRRLELVARAYEPVSRTFVAAHGPVGADSVVDVGCGPGYTTALLVSALKPTRTIGVDASPDFLRAARARVPAARFVVHDASTGPLPRGRPDVVYARLLLAHLPDPLDTLERWRSQVAPGGVILVEDLDSIEAPPGPLRAYDDLSAVMVRQGGGVMYAGNVLAGLGGARTAVTVTGAMAATIYLFNVRRWLDDRAHSEHRPTLVGLQRDLEEIAFDDGGTTVSWIVRQLVLPAL